jgi:DNA repair protein RecN (Recombination protein N)
MLNLLQIRNFAIIDSLDLELGPGFTAITGETGAGKSILVDALGMLLGDRADSSSVRSGSDKAELSAEFELGEDSDALCWLREADLDVVRACLLRRLIGENGRSRAWINGTPVTLAQLQELGQRLVEIHGQNEHLRLVHAAEQFRLLDGDAACAAESMRVAERYAALHEVERLLAQLDSESPLAAGEMDLLRYQIDELSAAALTAEAFAQLEAEHRLLAKGSDIITAMQTALEMLENEHSGITASLQRALDQLAANASLDRAIENAVKALEEASINSEEARACLQSAVSRIHLSPTRLAELDHQLSRLHELARKHRVEPSRLHETLQSLRTRCERADTQQQRREDLASQHSGLLRDYRAAAKSLHTARTARAASLSAAVSELMQVLGMAGGSFSLRVEHDPQAAPSRRGDDRIELLVTANPGMPPGPLRKVASGGELARISLAIKVASAAGQLTPTQVFDEVDAGIGGETANAVGRLLQSVARQGQALCVTHLAQVAVCADQQFRVSKSARGANTRVETSLLDERGRVDEIARMLGGRLSEQSRAHASELLASGPTRH